MDDPAWASTSSPFIVVSWPGSTTQKPARTPGTGGGRGSRDHSGQRDAGERRNDARERHMDDGERHINAGERHMDARERPIRPDRYRRQLSDCRDGPAPAAWYPALARGGRTHGPPGRWGRHGGYGRGAAGWCCIGAELRGARPNHSEVRPRRSA
jgi:hypothetical protein